MEPAPEIGRRHPGGSARPFDVAGLRALRSVNDFELHRLAFLERTEPGARDGRVVDEDVTTALALDKPVTLGVVEPLDLACDTHRSVSCLLVAAQGRESDQPSSRQAAKGTTGRYAAPTLS